MLRVALNKPGRLIRMDLEAQREVSAKERAETCCGLSRIRNSPAARDVAALKYRLLSWTRGMPRNMLNIYKEKSRRSCAKTLITSLIK